jgi:tetratricopeptide (TPR) repeat protein
MVAPSFSSYSGSRRGSDATTLVCPSPVSKENAFGRAQRQRWNTLVVKLWVMCTSSFIKAGRLNEAVQAILEAEELGLTDADVWHQLGLLCLKAYQVKKASAQDNNDDDDELYNTALDAFKKALAIDPDHIQTHVDMAATWIEHQDRETEWELAEALLDRTTKSLGWDHEEAWFLLGQVYRHQNSMVRAKECLLYALELAETKPLRPFSLLPRFV